ncbi:ATP-grasp domain-containing protein [Inhella proteolytica]|uniref:ATP-grasp domain-containing protein n=1 Tax=Inhella proteolytica TaxID=2795029 RepID=A0A931J7J8_9BURK|nr:ATP-grasp domain-containing protein [Inhella proteolytica]MBH9579238.1 ATP-grasp domain-containing protein [Inhella proteolytica]
MHWILQKNLINPTDLARFERALQEHQTPYSLVSLVPFFHELADEPEDLPADGIFVYGSTGLGQVARTRRWMPGYFDEGLDYELMIARYGRRALNAGAICAPLQELTRVWDRFFVRPVLDNKSFAGTVMTWQELEEFRGGVARVADAPDVTLRLTDRVVMAPLSPIDAEFRFFVIGGEVVTGSRYKLGDRLAVSNEIPQSVLEFAQSSLDIWIPNKAFTLDVAVSGGDLRVLELNSANSAGVYACDVGLIVAAVNSHLAA